MTSDSAFWDTSALVPLCVRQHNTAQAISYHKNYSAVIWWSTPVEIASALARLVRMKQLTSSEWLQARKLASRLADTWSVIQPLEAVRTRGLQLIEQYDLRAADALQLAAAIEWCDGNPNGSVLLSGDGRLLGAALLAGFDAREI